MFFVWPGGQASMLQAVGVTPPPVAEPPEPPLVVLPPEVVAPLLAGVPQPPLLAEEPFVMPLDDVVPPLELAEVEVGVFSQAQVRMFFVWPGGQASMLQAVGVTPPPVAELPEPLLVVLPPEVVAPLLVGVPQPPLLAEEPFVTPLLLEPEPEFVTPPVLLPELPLRTQLQSSISRV